VKELQITKSVIEVSANPHSPTGWYARHMVKGILPGCRKVTDLSVTPMTGHIWVKNLWSYNGNANINPSDWKELIKATPVVTDKLFPYTLTPEIVKAAYVDALHITDCPAVTDTTHVRPGYGSKVGTMFIDPAIMVVNRG